MADNSDTVRSRIPLVFGNNADRNNTRLVGTPVVWEGARSKGASHSAHTDFFDATFSDFLQL
jgi:hypothetical protein